MKTIILRLLVFFCFPIGLQAQYSADFSTPGKGTAAIAVPCIGTDPSACDGYDISGVNWSMLGTMGDPFNFNVGEYVRVETAGSIETLDPDGDVCIESVPIDISGQGTVTMTVSVSEIGTHESTDHITFSYTVDDGAPVSMSVNDDFNTQTWNPTASGNLLTMKVCLDNNSVSEVFRLSEMSTDKGIAVLPGGDPELDIRNQADNADINNTSTTINSDLGTDFGSVCVTGGSSSNSYRAENNGTGTLTFGSDALSISNTTDFSITDDITNSGTLLSNGVEAFGIQFNPASAGTKTCTVTVRSDDTDEDPYTFQIEGFGAGTPSMAEAGSNQDVCGTSTFLSADDPAVGTGEWSITGVADGLGILDDASDRNSSFSGTVGQTYTLTWTVSSPCSSTADVVDISFATSPSTSNAGPNQTVCGISTSLEGNNPTIGSGEWSEVGGDGNGSFDDASVYNTIFTGTPGVTYTLLWRISNGPCPQSLDAVDITLVDDAVSVSVSPVSVLEDGTNNLVYTFTRACTENAITVNFDIDDDLNSNNDYVQSGATTFGFSSGTISFGVGESMKTITIDPTADTKPEIDETMKLTVTAGTGYSVGSPNSATGTVEDDDSATVSINDVTMNEGDAGSVSFCFNVSVSAMPEYGISMTASTANGSATNGGPAVGQNDYIPKTDNVFINSDFPSPQQFCVTVLSDVIVELDEEFFVNLTNLNAGGQDITFGDTQGKGTITNDDQCVVTFDFANTSIPEGNSGVSPYSATISVSNTIQGELLINFNKTDGTATLADNDYDNGGIVTYSGSNDDFPTSDTYPNFVFAIGDTKVEPDETFNLNAVMTTNGLDIVFSTGGTSKTIPLTILNDDIDWGDAPDPTYPTLAANSGPSHGGSNLKLGATNDGESDGQPTATADGDMSEDDGVTFTSSLLPNTSASVTVEVLGAGLLNAWVDFDQSGTFDSPGEQVFTDEFVASGVNFLNFSVPAGAAQGTTFARFRLSTAGGLTPTGPAVDGEVEDYQVTINSTQFSVDDPMVTEGDNGLKLLRFNVTRTNNTSDCSVAYIHTSNGTADPATDYFEPISGVVGFSSGGSLTKDFVIPILGDKLVELDETIVMSLINPVNGTIADGTGVGTIKNDDSAIITVGSPSITEGDAGTFSMIFDVNLSNPVDVPVNLNHATSDGTATTADLDFQPTAGMSTIMAGSLMGSVQVLGNGDCQIEADEFFNLTLNTLGAAGRDVTFAGGGASLIGMATILNDDDLPEVYIPAEFTQGNDPGQCSATVTVPKASTASICGTGVLEFRYRQVLPGPTTAWSAWIPEANNTQVFAVGRHEVEWRITDDSGSNVGNFFFNVVDIESPVISCKAHTAQLDGFGNASIVPTDVYASGSDNCGTVHLVSVTPNTFTCADLGTVMVTLNATDDSGNPGSCMAEVTVADGIAPEAVCQDISIDLDENGMAGIMPADVDGGTGDNCGFALSLDDMDFECADIPSTTVTLTVTDASGNSHSCDATVTVNDVTPPNVTCMDATVELDANGMVSITPATIFAGSSDNCGFIGISGMSETDFDCDDVGENIVTLSVFDGNGNNNSCDATVTVEDNTPSMIACNDLSLSLNSLGQVSITPFDLFDAVNSTDNCGTFNLVSISQSDFTCVDEGVNTITLSVEDAGGNISTCDATVTIAEFLRIISVDHTDETCPNAGDGTISIVATAPYGQLLYSVDNGDTWQATGEFNFLSPGTYNIVVQVYGIASLCVKTAIEVVGTDPNGTSQTWYKDNDDDGYSDGVTLTQCQRPAGFKLAAELTSTSGDCNDNDANEVPGQTWYADLDGDGYGDGNSVTACARPIGYYVASELIATSGDCDNSDVAVNPAAVEICNGIDDDCDGEVDEGVTGTLTYVGNVLFTTQAQVDAFSQCYSIIQGNLTIQNIGVNDLSNLINLTEVTGNVYIKSTGLNSMNGLDNLTTVGGYLRIQSNNSLTTLDGLDAVTSVGSYLRVYRNSNLTDCCAIHDLLANGGVGGSTTISRNDTGCDSVSEIETDCAGGNNFIAPPSTAIGTNQVDLYLAMEVFPNPNNGIFTIRLNGFENPGVLRLMDTSGREVWRADFTEGENSFPVKMQVPVYGIYILHATDGTQSIQEKVLLRK